MLHRSSIDVCRKCGAESPADNMFGDRCRLCFDSSLHFERAISVGSYHGVLQEVVIRMKQRQNEVLAYQAGQLLGLMVEIFDLSDSVDRIVPVPTHWTRRLKRGCHVASVISEGVSRQTGLRASNRTLYSVRRTSKQGMLSGPKRRRNVRGAFALRHRVSIEGERILLVDDVMTSGATASEAAWTMLKAGASSVVVAVVARGEGAS
ncbi:MAG: phosphoribosyltransferase family protein [Planctomycetota bacterium]